MAFGQAAEMSKPPADDVPEPALFELENVSVPRRRRRAIHDEIIVSWSPDITAFDQCVIPNGLISSTLSIDTKGIASMLGVFADEEGTICPAPSYVQLAGMYLNGHPAEVVQRLNEMIVAGWLFYIGPHHFKWGTGEAPVSPRLIPPSAVQVSPIEIPVRKTISREELRDRADAPSI